MFKGAKQGRGQLQLGQSGGDLIVCLFDKDEPTGDGILYRDNGDYFSGKIEHFKMKSGVVFKPDGTRYEGDFVDDLFEGSGSLVLPDKSRYKGQFQKGKRSGRGLMQFVDGSVYEGEWADDCPHGVGIMKDVQGKNSQVRYQRGTLIS